MIDQFLNIPELTGEQPYFFHWIQERENARRGHDLNIPKPWTQDKILQTYRFCNVNRENDTVTKWIRENWREPYDGHKNMMFAMCLARLVNRVETLKIIGFPEYDLHNFDLWKSKTREKLKNLRAKGKPIWTGAYLISTNGVRMDKVDYILDVVLSPISFGHTRLNAFKDSLQKYHIMLTEFTGMGSFMAAQVIADLKYTSILHKASDLNTWAAIGPGSRRGLNRFYGKNLEQPISKEDFLKKINSVQLLVKNILNMNIHAQDIQNCFCEFDKYCRVKNGEGRPRSLYKGI